MSSEARHRFGFMLWIAIAFCFCVPSVRVSADPISSIVFRVAGETGIPEAIILGVIATESAFDPKAVSSHGAVGLMQVVPSTAEQMGVDGSLLTDPYPNILAGSRYLKTLFGKYGSWSHTFSAYYMGPGKWEKRRSMTEAERKNHIRHMKRLGANIQKYSKTGKK